MIHSFGIVQPPSAIPVVFYRTAQGGEPVRDWLRELPIEDRRRIGRDLALVQYGWPIGMPLCNSPGGGLWQVRSNLPSRRIARLLFLCMRLGSVWSTVSSRRGSEPRPTISRWRASA
jgi:hypothetical protein